MRPSKIAQMDNDIKGQYFSGINTIGNRLKPKFIKVETLFQTPGSNTKSKELNKDANIMVRSLISEFKTRPFNIECFEDFVVKYEDNQWKEFFMKTKSREPSISPDGKIMHLGKNYRKLTNTGWSEPISLEAPFKDYRIMRLTSSSNKTYYFDEASESGPLRYSRLINGKYEEPKEIRIEDIGDWNAHPYIAPDESYIIWDDQREFGGNGGADLYISFRKKDGSWGNSINLGNQINSEHNDAYGSISPDGKYFFFIRSYGGNKADIYWVDASIVLSLKPND